MKRPAVSRMLHVYNRPGARSGGEAAVITYVWGDTLVNVAGWDSNGSPFALTSVQLIREDEAPLLTLHAQWPPLL